MLLMVRNVRLTQKVVVVVVFIAVYVSVVAFPGWCMWKSRLNSSKSKQSYVTVLIHVKYHAYECWPWVHFGNFYTRIQTAPYADR